MSQGAVLGGAALAAAACAASAVLAWPRPLGPGRLERLGQRPVSLTPLSGGPWHDPCPGTDRGGRRPAPRQGDRNPGTRARPAVAVAALAAWQVVGGLAGICVGGLLLVALPFWLRRLEPASVGQERLRLLADLPLSLDLTAACLAAGAVPYAALSLVSEAVSGPVGRRLSGVAAALRLGADPAVAWSELAGEPTLAHVARTIARTVDSGAALGPTLERVARDLRVRRHTAAEAAARVVAVKAVAPLGACFLPAFVLLGIVPTIWGIASGTLASRW